MWRLHRLLISLPLIATVPAWGVTPYLVRDINPEVIPASSEPHGLGSLGGLALFTAAWPARGTLWRSDGTSGGTYPLLEAASIELLALTADRCFFLSYQPELPAWLLWVTDGTLPGTVQLTETGLGISTAPGRSVWVARQRALYFAAGGPGQGLELWRTDGTPGGTFQVADIWPGSGGSSPSELVSFKGNVYFAARDPDQGPALWRSDGTADGTVLVRDTAPDSTRLGPSFLRRVGSRLIFVGSDRDHGNELWTSDGTAQGTRLLTELVPGKRSAVFYDFAVHGPRLFFAARAGSGASPELWVTDGTARGTRVLTHFSVSVYFQSLPLPRASLGERLVFAAYDRTHGAELWSTDGTVQGTRLVRDLCPGACSGASFSLVRHEGRLYFRGTDGVHGEELWGTDGTARGTRLVRDICRGGCASRPAGLRSVGDHLFFVAEDANHTFELWSTDGTARGTVLLSDLDLPLDSLDGVAAGGMLIFAAPDPVHGTEPWCSDGTPEGTRLLADLADADLSGSFPGELMVLGRTVLFFANDGENGYQLWRSDGTAVGTSRVADLQPGGIPAGRPKVRGWTAGADRVIFDFDPSAEEASLWTSDGTADGTYRLTPEGVRSTGLLSPPVHSPGFLVLFTAVAEHGAELWATDGTVAGTRRVADLLPGPDSSFPTDFVLFQGSIWFVAHGPGGYVRWWRSDGTAAGTVPVGPELWSIENPVVHGGQLWFLGWNGNGLKNLWSTDGTAGGTRLRVEMDPGRGSFHGFLMVSDGVRLYLSGHTDDGFGLWVSSGAPAGTRKISDAYPGSARDLALFGGRLYFAGSPGSPWKDDLYVSDGTEAGTHPLHAAGGQSLGPVENLLPLGSHLLMITGEGELWQTNGMEAGTTLVRDQAPMPLPYEGLELVRAGSRAFFPGWSPETGWELWAVQE